LIVGPESALSAMVGTALIPLTADPDQRASLAALLALLVAGAFLGAMVARLGWIADYFSRPVLIGYLHGIAVVLVIGQLGKLLGLSVSGETPPAQLIEVIREIIDLSWITLAVGLASLVLLLLARWVFPKFPGALVVVILAIAVSAIAGLADKGVAVVGHIPAGLPSIEFPDIRLRDIFTLLPAAVGIFSSVSLAKSSPPGPLPAATASTFTRTPSWLPWVRPTWWPESARASRSARATPARPSMIKWARALRSRDYCLRW